MDPLPVAAGVTKLKNSGLCRSQTIPVGRVTLCAPFSAFAAGLPSLPVLPSLFVKCIIPEKMKFR